MWASLKKMLTLEWALFKLSAIADLQVPFNLGLQFLNDILWYSLQIVLFEALHLHVDKLNAIFALSWLLWSLTLLPGGFPWIRSLLIFIVVPAVLSIFYATRLIFSTVALLITRAEHFHDLYFTLFRMGQRPDRLYGPGIRYFILLVIPVGMIASFPTRVLVDPADNGLYPYF